MYEKPVLEDRKYYDVTSNRQPIMVAEITGKHPKYKLDRRFMDAGKDGRCDVWGDFEDGHIYNVIHKKDGNKMASFYFIVVDGQAVDMTEGDVIAKF